MSSNFDFPFQRGTESLPTEPNQRLGSVRQSGSEPNDEFTQEVMERNSVLIDMFIRQSRQEANLSGLDIYYNQGTYPEFDITYIIQFGKEHINVSPRVKRPKKEGEEKFEIITDIMKDGYLVVFVYTPKKWSDWTSDFLGISSTYTTDTLKISLNDQILTNYTPEPDNVVALLFRFGKHAMSWCSYRDSLNPNELVHNIIPNREDINNRLKADLPAYIIYDKAFLKSLNLKRALLELDSPRPIHGSSEIDKMTFTELDEIDITLVDMGEYDVDIIKPFDNTIKVEGSYNQNEVTSSQEFPGVFSNIILFGEFYDRNPDTFRLVDQSWRYLQKPEKKYLVNNKPLKFFGIVPETDDDFLCIKIYKSHDNIDVFSDVFNQQILDLNFNLDTSNDNQKEISLDMFGTPRIGGYGLSTPNVRPEALGGYEIQDNAAIEFATYKAYNSQLLSLSFNGHTVLEFAGFVQYLFSASIFSFMPNVPIGETLELAELISTIDLGGGGSCTVRSATTSHFQDNVKWRYTLYIDDKYSNYVKNWDTFLNIFRDKIGIIEEDKWVKE